MMELNEKALQKVREDRFLIDQVDLWLFELIEPYIGQRILEIGCGMGNFAHHLLNRELYIGTDISADSVAHFKKVFGTAPNILASVVDVGDASFQEFSNYNVDTIFSLNVFEHIEDDRLALTNAVSVMQTGGRLILVVPAHNWLYGTLDRAIGHYRRYDKQQMLELFRDVQLHPISLRYVNLLGAVGWFINGRIRREETPPSGQLRLFNKLVPFLKGVERIVPVPFGISLLAIGAK